MEKSFQAVEKCFQAMEKHPYIAVIFVLRSGRRANDCMLVCKIISRKQEQGIRILLIFAADSNNTNRQ